MEVDHFQIIDYQELEGVSCPCGTARRALMDSQQVPYSLHVTEIRSTAQTHYHKSLTETYYILSCKPDAKMELNGELFSIRPNMAIMIPPGVRHRAVGEMKVLIVVTPKFDPSDEWFD